MAIKLSAWQARYYVTFQVYRDKKREWRWRLKHANQQVIAVSGEGYTRKGTCLLAVRHFKTRLGNAQVRVQDARTGRYRSWP